MPFMRFSQVTPGTGSGAGGNIAQARNSWVGDFGPSQAERVDTQNQRQINRVINYATLFQMLLTVVSFGTSKNPFEWSVVTNYAGKTAWLYPDNQIFEIGCNALGKHVIDPSIPTRRPLTDRTEEAMADNDPFVGINGCYVRYYGRTDLNGRYFCQCPQYKDRFGSEIFTIQGTTFVYGNAGYLVNDIPIYALAIRSFYLENENAQSYTELYAHILYEGQLTRMVECGFTKGQEVDTTCEKVLKYGMECGIFKRKFQNSDRMFAIVPLSGSNDEWQIVYQRGQLDLWYGLGQSFTLYQPLGNFLPQQIIRGPIKPTIKPTMGWEGFAYQNIIIDYDYGYVAMYTLQWFATLVVTRSMYKANAMPTTEIVISTSRLGSFNFIAIQQIIVVSWIFDRINVKKLIASSERFGSFETILVAVDMAFIFLAVFAFTLFVMKRLDSYRDYGFLLPWTFFSSLTIAIINVLVLWYNPVRVVEFLQACPADRPGFTGCYIFTYTWYYVVLVVLSIFNAVMIVYYASRKNQPFNTGVHQIFKFYPYATYSKHLLSQQILERQRNLNPTNKLSNFEVHCAGCNVECLQTTERFVQNLPDGRRVTREGLLTTGFTILDGHCFRLKDAFFLYLVNNPVLRVVVNTSPMSTIYWPIRDGIVQPPRRIQYTEFMVFAMEQKQQGKITRLDSVG